VAIFEEAYHSSTVLLKQVGYTPKTPDFLLKLLFRVLPENPDLSSLVREFGSSDVITDLRRTASVRSKRF